MSIWRHEKPTRFMNLKAKENIPKNQLNHQETQEEMGRELTEPKEDMEDKDRNHRNSKFQDA